MGEKCFPHRILPPFDIDVRRWRNGNVSCQKIKRKEFENLRKCIRDRDRTGSAQHVKQTVLNAARMKELIVENRHVTFRDNGLHWSCTSEVHTGLK